MKFTSEDLMKAMGLSIGDRVKVKFDVCTPYYQDTANCICEIIKNIQGHIMIRNENHQAMFIHNLVDMDFEILPRPKRVGEFKCKDFECAKCHLRCLPHCNQSDSAKKTLFNILNGWNEYDTFDQEIYDLLKARLDKEVQDNDKTRTKVDSVGV